MITKNNLYCFSLVLLIVFLIVGCSSNYKTSEEINKISLAALKELVIEKYVDNYSFNYSRDSNYVIVKKQSKSRNNENFNHTLFFIYDLNENNIIYEESISRGDVKWISSYQVEISYIPGRIKDGENVNDYIFVYDVKQNKKVKKSLKKIK